MSDDMTFMLDEGDTAISKMKDQIARRCVFFTGALDKTCKAGVILDSVRRKEPWPFLPCVRFLRTQELIGLSSPRTVEPPNTCEKRHFPTPDEVEKEHAESLAVVRKFFEKLAAGVCPYCEKPLEPLKTVGHSVYGACGHRLGGTGA